jgi:PAS domain S-box-containing protein
VTGRDGALAGSSREGSMAAEGWRKREVSRSGKRILVVDGANVPAQLQRPQLEVAVGIARRKRFESLRSRLGETVRRHRALVETQTRLPAWSADLCCQSLARHSGAERLRLVVESAPNGMIMAGGEGTIYFVNHQIERMFGYDRDELLGEKLEVLMPERFCERHVRLREAFLREADARPMGDGRELYAVRKDGTEFPVEIGLARVETPDGPYLLATIVDSTDRRRAETDLAYERSFSAAVLDTVGALVVVLDVEGRIVRLNETCLRVTGYTADEVLGRTVWELFIPPEEQQDVSAIFERLADGGSPLLHENQWIVRNGERKTISWSNTVLRTSDGAIQYVIGTGLDVTEQKELEEQFLRAQRLESLGTLAAGISHDLGNVLSPMMMAVQALKTRQQDEGSRKLLDVLELNCARGADMIRQILTFARGARGERMLLQPKHLLDDIGKLVKETFPREIAIRIDVPRDLWLVTGDATQIHQVVVNLCVNARDAMARGGTLLVHAENVSLDEVYARMHVDAKAGRYVMISVSDTGTGIPAEQREKIFDPFFTTKEPGKGTGLGLATVVSITRGHGGFVNLYSEPDRGTEFKVYLPAAKGTRKELADGAQMRLPLGNNELLLVVDDEISIREVTKQVLEAHGYRVLTAADGVEAIAVFVENQHEISAVVIDMVMPHMNGANAIRCLKKIDPSVKVIAMSALAIASTLDEQIEDFLVKPFTAQRLQAVLARVLGASRDRSR